MVFVATLAAVGQGQPVSPQDLAKVLAARDMRKRLEAGDVQGAEALEAQVRARGGRPPLHVTAPSLPDRRPEKNSRAAILQALAAGEDPALYEAFLEDLVAKDPLDHEARAWLLIVAERRGDHVAIQRHRAHLPHPRENFPWWKLVLAGGLCGMVVWQAVELWRDWSRSPGPTDSVRSDPR